MNLSKYVLPLPFIIAFFFGMMMCYIFNPEPEIVFRHPTPENAGKTIYKDKSNNCYKYEVDEVPCPEDKSQITEQPVNKS